MFLSLDIPAGNFSEFNFRLRDAFRVNESLLSSSKGNNFSLRGLGNKALHMRIEVETRAVRFVSKHVFGNFTSGLDFRLTVLFSACCEP